VAGTVTLKMKRAFVEEMNVMKCLSFPYHKNVCIRRLATRGGGEWALHELPFMVQVIRLLGQVTRADPMLMVMGTTDPLLSFNSLHSPPLLLFERQSDASALPWVLIQSAWMARTCGSC
jgi:hypothetical protein